ncbi:NUDIX hydrolase [Cellulophaga lytica]|uniref:NUDIX hydrolase n=1 Tax=Cellulophaga lytica TaxID=979 RepID=UPI0004F82F32|nr:NUDIX domain-containing protein [Cellulophaga lytica]AIM60532.1 NUDIX hydrolase [Cellulophaga lytica]
MQNNQNIKVAVDAVVFGYHNNALYVLLVQQKYGVYKDQWVLPGGLVHNGETLTKAVHRELQEEAGITVNYLEQLYTFGDDVERDKRNQVISVSYFALVNPDNLKLSAATDAQDVKWQNINNIPKLPFDHNLIIDTAFKRIKAKLHYQPIGFDLLPKKFPFSDLEHLYATILEQEIDRRNFRKKILSFGFIKKCNEKQKNGSGRPAQLYTFDPNKYKALEKNGMHFEIKFA